MSEGHGDIKKQVRIYLMVFGALMVGTILTVLAAKVHLAFGLAVVVALIIATVKGSLVAAFFMHLSAEKKLIYTVLVFAAIFFVVLMGLFMWAHADQQHRAEGHGAFMVLPAKAEGGAHGGHAPEPAEKH